MSRLSEVYSSLCIYLVGHLPTDRRLSSLSMAQNSPLTYSNFIPQLVRQRGTVAVTLLAVKDNQQLALLHGSKDIHLQHISKFSGYKVFIKGEDSYAWVKNNSDLKLLKRVLDSLLSYVKNGIYPEKSFIQSLFSGCNSQQLCNSLIIVKNLVRSRNQCQNNYLQAIGYQQPIFSAGPTARGKTHLALAVALQQILCRQKKLPIFSRLVLEAGEQLGFLPGDGTEKIAPYLKALNDVLHSPIGAEKFDKLKKNQQIKIVPLAYMRGRSLDNAFIIHDEAQNSSKTPSKSFLSRLGGNCTRVLPGNPTQSNLANQKQSGLEEAAQLLADVDGISIQPFENQHIAGRNLILKIVKAYSKNNLQKKEGHPINE